MDIGGTTRRLKVAIVSGSSGGGHDAMAYALRDEFARRHPGVEATYVDGLALVSPDYPAKEEARVFNLIKHAPWAWSGMVKASDNPVGGAIARTVAAHQFAGPLARHFAENPVDAVVSTYPGMTSGLAKLARKGTLDAPLSVVIIDSNPHPTWFGRGAAQHMPINPNDAARAVASNPLGDTEHLHMRPVRPVVNPRIEQTYDDGETKSMFGLATDRPNVVVSGGSMALLDRPAIRRLLDANPDAAYAVLTGRDARLAKDVEAVDPSRVRAIPFTTEMPRLIHAADAVIGNSAGMTTWESFRAGTPVIHDNVVGGHGVAGVRGLDEDGFSTYARRDSDLTRALGEVASGQGRAVDNARRAAALFEDPDVPFMSDAVLSTIRR